ncbi:MAG: CPBP family glutamic-type intramembrane protease [Thermoflexales bacterium]|nr:CPBP family glutamic-type intramembrane protease [Thermoflexales bacterium]MDW8351473.1 CPBP family glutamic-type intramembrane protease [Anaerolineae bacterium]
MNEKMTFNPVRDFFAFLRRPNAERVVASLGQKLLILAALVAVDILFGFVANLLSTAVESLIPLTESEHVMVEEPELLRFMQTAGILIIPLLEELGFRLWLAPNVLFLFISFFLVTIQFAPLPFADLLVAANLTNAAPLVKIAFYGLIGAGIALFFWVRERRGHPYADFFRRYVGVYYYFSSLLFGFIHLTNYTSLGAWWYAPILILPQIIGGFVFGYVRIRLGFWYAVLAHIAANLLFTFGDFMNGWFGTAGGVVWLAVLILSSLALIVLISRRRLISIQIAP